MHCEFASTERNQRLPPPQAVPVYLDVHPLHDFEIIGRTGPYWVGLRRRQSSSQLVLLHRVQQTSLADFRRLSRVAHPYISRPVGLYLVKLDAYIAFEHTELDVHDLPFRSVADVGNIMAQVRRSIAAIAGKAC